MPDIRKLDIQFFSIRYPDTEPDIRSIPNSNVFSRITLPILQNFRIKIRNLKKIAWVIFFLFLNRNKVYIEPWSPKSYFIKSHIELLASIELLICFFDFRIMWVKTALSWNYWVGSQCWFLNWRKLVEFLHLMMDQCRKYQIMLYSYCIYVMSN